MQAGGGAPVSGIWVASQESRAKDGLRERIFEPNYF